MIIVYQILSIKLPRGGGGILERGAYLFLLQLHNNFPPAQSNVCKTTMYSNNFNTTLNVLRC